MLDDNIARAGQALEAAYTILATRFAGASHAFVTGSILRGQGTPFSDIDLVVMYPALERAHRESFVAEGFPVEAFVHDAQTLGYFLDKDAESGCPIMANMVADAVIIGTDVVAARAQQAEARQIIAKGPAPLAGPAYAQLLYQISDFCDDLRGGAPADEVASLAVQIYPRLIDLMLLGRGQWSGRGKWAPRLLRRYDANLADALVAAFARAAQGDASDLLTLVDAELARHGGLVFDGYRLDAPLEARRL